MQEQPRQLLVVADLSKNGGRLQGISVEMQVWTTRPGCALPQVLHCMIASYWRGAFTYIPAGQKECPKPDLHTHGRRAFGTRSLSAPRRVASCSAVSSLGQLRPGRP